MLARSVRPGRAVMPRPPHPWTTSARRPSTADDRFMKDLGFESQASVTKGLNMPGRSRGPLPRPGAILPGLAAILAGLAAGCEPRNQYAPPPPPTVIVAPPIER